MTRSSFFLLSALVLGAVPACSDPIQSGIIEAQGKEIEGIPKGPLHRSGQPCVACHSKNGPASNSIFTVAGTIFQGPSKLVGVNNAEVRMTDSLGTKHVTKTNCVGNFMVKPDEWDPKFPILVAVAKGGTLRRMNSVIGREASCGSCHTPNLDRDPTSQLVQVFLFGTEEVGAGPVECEVDPRIR
ncbi:MAG: hypothetical protein IPG50_10665 [Myxococcales bacterium]|nr:hypothetical protein [Myxococcales bacterium]